MHPAAAARPHRLSPPAWLVGLALLLSPAPARAQAAAPAPGGRPVGAASPGWRMPRVHLASLTDAATLANPAPGLVVYNTNVSLPGGVGFYLNASPSPGQAAWTPLDAGVAAPGTGAGLATTQPHPWRGAARI